MCGVCSEPTLLIVPGEGVLLGEECPVNGHRTKDGLRGCITRRAAPSASLFACLGVAGYCSAVQQHVGCLGAANGR